MEFVVEFLREKQGSAKFRSAETVSLESDDIFSVVARMRIILSSTSYDPTVKAFQIVDGARVLYHESRHRAIEQAARS
jgi:hypothetical protein